MTLEILFALFVFALAMSGTPGPNNLMLVTSGVNFGFRRSQAHMAGVVLGFGLMILMVGLGLAGIFTAWPPARLLLQVASVGYMLWLAWRIATAGPPAEGGAATGSPLGFLQAAGFQWVNPKAWATALSAIVIYAPGRDPLAVLLVALVFVAAGAPCVAVWTGLGVGLRQWLADPRRLRIFNLVMAALLVLSLWPVLGLGAAGGS